MEQTLEDVLGRGDAADLALIVPGPGGPRLTYRQLRARVAELAQRLAGMGVGRGDRVAIVFPNGAEAIVAFLAAATVATAAPLNPAYTETEFRFSLEDSGARVLVTGPGQAAAARAAIPAGGLVVEAAFSDQNSLKVKAQTPRSNPVDNHSEAAPVPDSLALGGAPQGWGGDGAEPGVAAAGFTAEPSRLREVAAADGLSPDDVALVLHTSGTTSRPKRVPLRHRNLAASVDNIVRSYQLGPGDVSLCAMPLFHVHGLVASALATFGAGGTVVAPALDHPLGLLPLLASQRVTWFSGSPTLHRLLLRRAAGAAGDRARFPALRFVRSCSAALPLDQFHEMQAAYGVPVLEAYGMTEASHQM
ncbi:MAG TPA: AMP-binding protein, partial [Actinomycetota bacterium]